MPSCIVTYRLFFPFSFVLFILLFDLIVVMVKNYALRFVSLSSVESGFILHKGVLWGGRARRARGVF